VVEVDPETGAVRLLRHVACDDAGPVHHQMLFDGQRRGGAAQGIGQALYEEFRYDADGNPQTTTFADYAIPGAPELPDYELVDQETPTPFNPLGVKGVGESGTIGSTPAVVAAVVDALAPLGIRGIEMPATPGRVWAAIAAATA
jgi:carbon-monoxide dehydrogenase large subunit